MTAVPSSKQLSELLDACRLKVGGGRVRAYGVEPSSSSGFDRKVSTLFASELRKRGWLASEGYAPGSWAAK